MWYVREQTEDKKPSDFSKVIQQGSGEPGMGDLFASRVVQ